MRVYSERSISANGIVTNVGEDAFPYVNNAGMFVADGMGGGAGVPILRFDDRCFNVDELSRMLCDYFKFQSITEEEEFSNYSKVNFSSLSNPVMKDLYRNPKSNTLRLKKSGYVGSHALGTVLAAMLIQLSSSISCQEMDYSLWKERTEKLRDCIFDQYQSVISILGSEYVRVNIDKIDYYGTTMAGVFFKENEDSVDAIFLNCGDSRSYVWDLNGFRQACDDQGRNGGMTSRFSLGKHATVDITYEVRNYKKPCSIFCMTDGFYGVFGGKNGFHSTPLYMEGFIMNVLSTQTSIENAASKMKTAFDAKGKIDDSNSMVMASFGYSTYEELKEAAKTRMDYLNREYCLDSMPEDFLLVDYKKIVSELQEVSSDSIKPLLKDAYNEATIQKYCLQQINQPMYGGKYLQEARIIDARIKDIEVANAELNKSLYAIAVDNFTDFVDLNYVEHSVITKLKNSLRGSRLENARLFGQSFSKNGLNRTKAIDNLVGDIATLNKTISSEVAFIGIDVQTLWTRSAEEDTLVWVRTKKDYISEIYRRSQESLSRIAEYSKYLTKDLEQWAQINKLLMNDYLDKEGSITPQKLVDNWIKDALIIEESVIDTTIPSIRFVIINLVKKYQANLDQINGLKIEYDQALEKAAYNYWEDNSCKDIHKLLHKDIYFINNVSLRQQIVDLLNQNEELVKYEKLSQKQDEIFNRYMKRHLSDTNEDKRNDVEKNGWM